MVGRAIYELLSNDAAVSAIVSGNIYPLRASQGEEGAYITYQLFNNQPNGTDKTPSGMDFVDYQINCYGRTPLETSDLANKVRLKLDTYVGVVTSGADQIDLRDVVFKDENDLYDDELEKAGRALDFEFSVIR